MPHRLACRSTTFRSERESPLSCRTTRAPGGRPSLFGERRVCSRGSSAGTSIAKRRARRVAWSKQFSRWVCVDAGHAAKTSTVAGGGPRLPEPGSRAAVILGNDAVVAARPCTPAQLAHACRTAGFDIVVPPSCGDELVAGAYLDRLDGCVAPVAAACNCARVQSLLRATPENLRPLTIATTSPPIAAARYLRLVYGDSILVTYVGDCASAEDPSINARFSPEGFFASLERQGIELGSQPNEMSEPESDRWRRYRSVPGGLPARRWLARPPVERVLREVQWQGVEAMRWPVSPRANVLLDLADAASCACGGNRTTIEECEPERSLAPVVVAPVGLDLVPPPVLPSPGRASQHVEPIDPAPLATAAAAVATPPGPSLDRQVVRAHRPKPSAVAAPPGRPSRSAAPPRPAPGPNRAALLATIPAVVLVAVAALGLAAYALTSPKRAATSSATGESSSASSPALAPRTPADSIGRPGRAALPDTAPPATADSARRATPLADSAPTRPESTQRVTPRRPKAARPPEIVPGWLPQGAKAWTPGDTNRPAKPDSTPRPGVRPDSVPPA